MQCLRGWLPLRVPLSKEHILRNGFRQHSLGGLLLLPLATKIGGGMTKPRRNEKVNGQLWPSLNLVFKKQLM